MALKSLVFVLTCLAFGFLLAGQVNRVLDIRLQTRDIPRVTAPMTPAVESSSIETVDAIVLPSSSIEDDLLRFAAKSLSKTLALRTGKTPPIVETSTPGRTVNIRIRANRGSPESFAITRDEGWVTISAGSRLGAAFGIYHFAGLVRSGLGDDELERVDIQRAPAFPVRLVETGGVGVPAVESDYAGGRDYSHHSGAFKDVIRVDPPFVNEANFERVAREFRAYVHHMISHGYNGIVINGFLEYVNFDGVGDGLEVYPADSVYRQRHAVLRDRFGALFRYASDMGMKVILRTDMLALTGPLEAYFQGQPGGLDASAPSLWATYQAGFAELFQAWPFVDGIMIRIGEAGHFANLPGWDYYSGLHVTTDEAVQVMLESLTSVADEWDKEVIFRTWSVGVGQVGDMHTNPATYERVIGGLDAPNLVVSTKYSMGDFYSYQAVNPTLQSGTHRRIVELQARLEFEGMGAFFNDIGPLHQAFLQKIQADNPHLEGIWTWTQEGGPIRAGPMIIYPLYGFWQPTDLNVYSAGQLGWDPGVDLGRVNQGWIQATFSDDPRTVSKLSRAIALSRGAVTGGLYIGEFARQKVRALGLEPPPMMWIFEWDMVSGSNSVLSLIHFAVRRDIDSAIAEGLGAVRTAREIQGLVAETDPSSYHDPALFDRLTASVSYQVNLLETLAAYRGVFLRYYDWLATGNESASEQWRESVGTFSEALHNHRLDYGRNLAFPAYDFSAAEIGMAHAHRGNAARWLARLALLGIGLSLLGGARAVQNRLPFSKGRTALRALHVGAFQPAKMNEIEFLSLSDKAIATTLPLALVASGWLAFSSGLSESFLLAKSTALGVFLLALLLLNRATVRHTTWCAVMGPGLLLAALPMFVVSVRGPLFFWYQFWTNPEFNSVFISVAVATAGWFYRAVYTSLRTAGGHAPAAAAGQLLLATGSTLFVLGGLATALGLEETLTALNNELAILPLGLSKILGITVHLDIPGELPLVIGAAGMGLMAAGVTALVWSRASSNR